MKRILLSLIIASASTVYADGTACSSGHSAPNGRPVGYVHGHVGHANYHVQYGQRFTHGVYYAGQNHHHWAHRYYDARYRTYLYFDPYVRTHYYWCQPAGRFYPVSYNPYQTYQWAESAPIGVRVPTIKAPAQPATNVAALAKRPAVGQQRPTQPQGPSVAPSQPLPKGQPGLSVQAPTIDPSQATDQPPLNVQTPGPNKPGLAPAPKFAPQIGTPVQAAAPKMTLAPAESLVFEPSTSPTPGPETLLPATRPLENNTTFSFAPQTSATAPSIKINPIEPINPDR